MRTLAVANQKGGVAKTNLTGNLAAELAALGHRVVAVDLDPQATLTTWLVGRTNARGSAEVLLGEEEAAAVVVAVPAFGVALLGAVPDRLRVAERTLAAQVGSERVFAKALRGLKTDFVITYRPDSTGAADYATLATEVLKRVQA
jgi:chromosome partitioning protein